MLNDTQKKIAVLKRARTRIDKERNTYVCVAIEDAGDDMGMTAQAIALMDEIKAVFTRDGVHGGSTVGDWLCKKHGANRDDMTRFRMRAYRVAWLDTWIADLENGTS